jgi:hypothetical protein
MKRGGGPLPLSYFDPNASQASASAGDDLLVASGQVVRQSIGGKARRASRRIKARKGRKARRVTKKARRVTKRATRGGFIPSIMEPFVGAASQYVTPLALFAGYGLMQRKQTKRKAKRSTRK